LINEAVEKHKKEYVAADIDGQLAGLRPVMQVSIKTSVSVETRST
jgi:hypothetical protein